MRKVLNALYDGAAAVAALFMVGLLVMVLLSVCGRQFNFYVPGTDAYAGYLMAASGFLALAHTLKRGEHIRVTLILSALSGRWKKGMEVWALVFATALSGMFAFYSCKLSWQSRMFNDISTGSDATPLWIPQIGMAVGTVILAIAFLDELVLELRGQREAHSSDEPLRNE
ncbi:MAG TPA: TRAP transporter small permease [Rhodoferax sp.]|jgi:TRAP-type C4-dicarboxylate transport system permease small subunit|nr:TRAP transporter small permease [Rhodoferax sp.]